MSNRIQEIRERLRKLRAGGYGSPLNADIDYLLKEVEKWRGARDACEQQFQDKVDELISEMNRGDELRCVAKAALPLVQYVSAGRKFIDVEPYPDVAARRVGAQLLAALDKENE
jgi:hypothetical protein